MQIFWEHFQPRGFWQSKQLDKSLSAQGFIVNHPSLPQTSFEQLNTVNQTGDRSHAEILETGPL